MEHCNLMSSSKCPFVAGLFPSTPEESTRSSYKFSSVSSRFKVRKLSTFFLFHFGRSCVMIVVYMKSYRLWNRSLIWSLPFDSSNNFKPSWKLSAKRSLTMFVVWSQTHSTGLKSLRILVFYINFVVGLVAYVILVHFHVFLESLVVMVYFYWEKSSAFYSRS